MGTKSFSVPIVNSLTLKWARETSGKSIAEISRKLGVASSVVVGWESGIGYPTLGQLEKLTVQYKRCLTALLLPEPPSESPPPTEYRTLPEQQRNPLGERALLAIRRARGIQSSFKELLSSLGDTQLPTLPLVKLNDEPEALAERMATHLGLADKPQRGSDYEVLAGRVRTVEAIGVLVLQLGMPVVESRAFSLADDAAPLIVLNSHDGPGPRSFSLFHEFAHLLLRRSGTCGKMASFSGAGSDQRVTEVFCNQFAGSLLVPSQALVENEVVQSHGSSPEWADSELSRLGTQFRVSRQVVLRRLLSADLTNHAFFAAKQRSLEQEAASLRRGSGGRADPPGRALRENGLRYTSLVLDAYRQEVIGPTGAADLLGVKFKHFSTLEALVAGVGV